MSQGPKIVERRWITPFARLMVAQLALEVEAQRLSLDETKRRLVDVTEANAALDEIGSTVRDALLDWPARVSGLIAAEISVEPNLLQTISQDQMNPLLLEVAQRLDPPSGKAPSASTGRARS